jgi:hypothetical protein
MALAMYRLPSLLEPLLAMNRQPGIACLESSTTAETVREFADEFVKVI